MNEIGFAAITHSYRYTEDLGVLVCSHAQRTLGGRGTIYSFNAAHPFIASHSEHDGTVSSMQCCGLDNALLNAMIFISARSPECIHVNGITRDIIDNMAILHL